MKQAVLLLLQMETERVGLFKAIMLEVIFSSSLLSRSLPSLAFSGFS